MNKLRAVLPDILMTIGAFTVSYGAWMVYQPAGFVVFGAFLLVAGVLAAKVSK